MNRALRPGDSANTLSVARLFLGALTVGTAFELLGIPAGMLLGAIIGAALSNQPWTTNWRPTRLPRPFRSVGLIILGIVTGLMLTWESLASTATIALPVAVSYFGLGVLNTLFAWFLMERYRVGPATAIFSVTPGGFGEVLSLAMERNAQIPIVLSVHAVRIMLLVLAIIPITLLVL